MEKFTAEDARRLSNILDEREIDKIIQDIKEFAECGHTQLSVYKMIKPATIQELTQRGFKVKNVKLSEPISIATFYVISW
jgi:UDP-N-acetylglucosamine 2-epimerase